MRRFIGVLGELFFTAGAVLLLYAAYLAWGTGMATSASQSALRDHFVTALPSPTAAGSAAATPKPGVERTPKFGDPMGLMRIPRLGADWQWITMEGTTQEVLADGPGHYVDTALPGQVGNFALAAHRATHGEPFAEFPILRTGDEVTFITAQGAYRYRLTMNPVRITPDEVWVLNPSGTKDASAPAKRRMITLTTCDPRWGHTHRLYVQGDLVEARGLTAADRAALKGGS